MHARDECRKFVLRNRFIERKERGNVRVPRKCLDRLAAHPARGRIGKPHARLTLELFELIIERIIFPVRNAGRVLYVVFVRPFVERIHKIAHSVHM